MPDFLAENLHKDENRYLHTALRAAERFNTAPLFFVLQDRMDPHLWTPEDKKLGLAWQTYQDELCASCGVPIWLGHAELSEIDFETKTSVCYSCQHIEQDKTDPPAGGTKYVIPKPVEVEGEEYKLPSRREGLKASQ